MAALGIWRDHERRDACARTEAVAPAGPTRRRDVIPEAAILVIGHDHRHPLPLRALAQPLKYLGDVIIAPHQVGISWMLCQDTDRLVEGDVGQRAGIDIAQEILAVLEMGGAICGAGRKPRMIIEGLVMRLEVGTGIPAGVDDLALFTRGS